MKKLDVPLVDALLSSLRSEKTGWHMPGHMAAKGFPPWLERNLAKLDATELPCTDDLNYPTGPARKAMDLAANAFGAGHTNFITAGATTAIHIMLACVVEPGAKVLVSRCCHKSVLSAAAILNLDIIWYQPDAERYTCDMDRTEEELFSLLYQPSADGIAKHLLRYPDCRAVLITAPDYYGMCADLAKIANVAHSNNTILLVDEAHGSHFAFDREYLPGSALASGADICVQSGHKTLPVLTQGALLHVSHKALQEKKIDLERLRSLIPIFQTSSPSFPIAATLDYARALMEAEGSKLIHQQLQSISWLRNNLDRRLVCSSEKITSASDSCRDPLRLVITSREDKNIIPAQKLAWALTRQGCNIEFADLTRIVLIPSLFQKKHQWRMLKAAINKSIMQTEPDISVNLLDIEKQWRQWLTTLPNPEIPLREMLFNRKNIVYMPLMQAKGKILARMITPYPPGIALFLPGEILEVEKLDFLRILLENNINITGINQEKIPVIG